MRSILSFLPVALLSATALADPINIKRDFVVITETGIAIPTITDEAGVSSFADKFVGAAMSLATAKPSSWFDAYSSAQAEASKFMETQTALSLPPIVTDPADFTIYNSAPEWYTKLPNEVKQYYEDNADIVKTLLKNEGEARGVKVMAGVIVAGMAGIALL
ncbi:hypothetical protein N0V90_011686 [Kalmusia sp. IMI 367209]|nr:hypothetical protein N0V90_011686 [Kalmusia sp. IMI 367209]